MTSEVVAQWRGHYKGRHAWAFQAYKDFMESLSADVRERLVDKDAQDEAYVVVFGKTQVGKTTLLLELMGVAASAMSRVSDVLRGGRGIGQSATATTMEYRRSTDTRWRLRQGNASPYFDRDAEMVSALAGLRRSMEAGLTQALPCEVWIPLDCFDAESDQPQVRMLDLPGDKPSNPVEQEHVEEMARRYVPLADLILLVGRGDDLSFLRPKALTLPGIEDWQIVPGRFRIITTYSFKAETVRKLIDAHPGELRVSTLRSRLIEQIGLFGTLGASARRPDRFFPLEFGKSWEETRKERHDLYRRVSPIIDEMKRQLLADIRSSTAPLARIKAAVQAHEVVSRVKEMRLGELRQQINQAAERHSREADAFALARQAAVSKKKNLAKLEQRLAWLDEHELSQHLEQFFLLHGNTSSEQPTTSVSDFIEKIAISKQSLKQRAAISRPYVAPGTKQVGTKIAPLQVRKRFWNQLSPNGSNAEIPVILEQAFSKLEDRLHSYSTDEYYPSLSDNYSKDLADLAACQERAERQILDACRQWWLVAAREKLRALRKEKQHLEADVVGWRCIVDAARARKAELTRDLQAIKRRCLTEEQRLDKDLAESRRFRQLLEARYLAELRQRRQHLDKQDNPSLRLIALLGAVHLGEARRELARATDDADI